MRTELASLVEDFRAHGADIAVVDHRGIRRFATTYRELAELAGRFSAELDARAIAPGDRVILWGANSAAWIAAFFGCLLRGVLVVPLDAAGSAAFANKVIADVMPGLVVGDAHRLQQISAATPQLELGNLNRLLPSQPHYRISDAVTADSPFQIVFTSGTTGEPRGIVHTHRNVLASLSSIESEIVKYRRYQRIVHPLRFLHTLPLSHVFGQFMGLWTPALLAAELHVSDVPDPSRIVYLSQRERISVLIAVPRVLELLRSYLHQRFPPLAAQMCDGRSLPAARRWWRYRAVHRAFGFKFWAVISGGAALPDDLERFWNALGFALIQGYGMTETAALITLNHPFHVSRGSLGRTLPGRELRLSETGEIQVRGDMVSRSTWQHGRLQPREEEWLATGDLGERTADGELRFVGRSGDAIVTAAGLNVYPADLESALMRQPQVHMCAVVPCRFETGMEPVAVVIVHGAEESLEPARLQANRELADHQKIRRMLAWPKLDFPYTSSGKLLRREIAAWACATLEGRRAGQEVGKEVGEDDLLGTMIAEITGERPRDAESLPLDSLGRVQLASMIEQRTGLVLDDEAMAKAETPRDLRALLQEARVAQDRAPAQAPANAPAPAKATIPRTQTAPVATAHEPEPMAYPHWPWSWPMQTLRSAFHLCVARPLVRLLATPVVTIATPGLPSAPALIICNHVTACDGALVLYALPWSLSRKVAAAMSGEMLADLRHARGQDNRLLDLLAPAGYWLLTALFNVFPLPRRRGFQRSFYHAGEALDRGYSVLVFPEGTRSKTGSLAPFRQGIGLLAHQAQATVLPVALIGLGGHHTRWFRSGRIQIRIGQPIPYDPTLTPADYTRKLEAEVRILSS